MNQLRQTRTFLFDFIQLLSENRKISLRYALILLPAAICMGAVCLTGAGENSELFVKVMQLLLFAVAGVVHLYVLKKKLSIFWFRFLGDGLLYTTCAGILVLIALIAFYSFTAKGSYALAIASSAVFVMPHLMLQAWSIYADIPSKEFKPWTKPLFTDTQNEILLTGHITMYFKLTRSYYDISEQLFMRNVPEQGKLGVLFFSLLNDENVNNRNGIENIDKFQQAFAWEFYIEQTILTVPLRPRRVDPELSLAENSIRRGSVIIAKRTSQSIGTQLSHFFSTN